MSSELQKAVLISKNNQKKVKQLTSEFKGLTEVNKELTRMRIRKKRGSKKIDALEQANKDLINPCMNRSSRETISWLSLIRVRFNWPPVSLYMMSLKKYQEVKKECARMSYRVIQIIAS